VRVFMVNVGLDVAAGGSVGDARAFCYRVLISSQ
jgi:hypothetical protein